MIELKNVEKSFAQGVRRNFVLHRVDVTIKEGEFVSIMGPSGAGKSTLLYVIGMHDADWTGEYYFGGEAIHKMNRKDRNELYKRNFGFIFQSYHLLDTLTVAENIEMPLTYRNIRKVEREAVVADTLDRFQMVGKKDLFPNQLSGGQQQLVGIARAMVANPKVILVTDRVDLDLHLYNIFRACGKNVVQAQSGKHLLELVKLPSADIIATVIDKFETVANEKVSDPNPNIFVLVDESHRSQYGTTHAKMRRVFPNACYLGATGTPLLKKEKTTAAKFGDFIHKYPMRQAVADHAVVALLYEGRLVELEPDQASIDRWFERVTKELSEEQKVDLKRKFSRQGEVNKAEQRLQQIAYAITEHYVANHQGTGRKAQLAAPSKLIALKYKEYLDEFGEVDSAVVIGSTSSVSSLESCSTNPRILCSCGPMVRTSSSDNSRPVSYTHLTLPTNREV